MTNEYGGYGDGTSIKEMLVEAGITPDHPEYRLQFSLAHCPYTGQMWRNGSLPQVKKVMMRHGYTGKTLEGMTHFTNKAIKLFSKLHDSMQKENV